MKNAELELGCGLIRIGRVWGVPLKEVPTEAEALNFLETAYQLGIRFFDTAPSYGVSEERLGKFLMTLSNDERATLTVATKFGEHWNSDTQEAYVDHSYDALIASLEQSFLRLGQIELLQLHKASVLLLESDVLFKSFDQAKIMGIAYLGVSVSDVETGEKATQDERISFIQLPYNQEKTDLLPVIEAAKAQKKKIIFNRPLAMGAVATSQDSEEKKRKMTEAYQHIAEVNAPGVILTGTASVDHLKENIESFTLHFPR